MEVLRELKARAGDLFKGGHFERACVTYGELMQAMIGIEESQDTKLKALEQQEFNALKAVVFSNIALGNLKLGAFEAVRRTCNASIAFINEPTLALIDLGLEERGEGDDVEGNPPISEPVREEVKSLAAKVLYRRACALHAMSGLEREEQITEDLQLALILAPADRNIEALMRRIEEDRESNSSSQPSLPSLPSLPTPDLLAVRIRPQTINGGLCFKRRGHWSQTVATAEVCLPLSYFLCTAQTREDFCSQIEEEEKERKGSPLVVVKAGVMKQSLSVSIEREAVTIRVPSLTHETGDECHQLPLEYYVRPEECSWSIDALYSHQDIIYPPSKDSSSSRSRKESAPSHLVLYLSKAPSVEWFPGCEWWSNVCIGDEEIDITTCTVGTDTSELPVEARLRAQKEHTRFTDQSEEERERELKGLAQIRKDVGKAVQRQEKAEQAAYGEEPERREMLGALSAEFPHIYFGAQASKDKDKDKDKE